MKSIVTPFGGVDHFLVYLNEDVGEKDSDKEWIGSLDVKKGTFTLSKNTFLINQSNYLKGALNPENPEFQLILEFHESSWNGLTSLLLSAGLLIGGGGTILDGLGMYSIVGAIVTVGSFVISILGGNQLKMEFDRYLEKYERHVHLNLKDAEYRQQRWGKKR